MVRHRMCSSCLFCFSVGFPVLILFVSVKPYQRGFYCDDESLMHPYKTNTIPTWVAGFVGVVLPSLSVCIQTLAPESQTLIYMGQHQRHIIEAQNA